MHKARSSLSLWRQRSRGFRLEHHREQPVASVVVAGSAQRIGEEMSLKQAIKRPGLRLYMTLSHMWPRRASLPPQPSEVRKILLFQFGGIGDSLRMIPLIRGLEETFPAAELATLTNQSPRLFELAPEEFPACRHLTFDFGHGVLAKWRRLRELRRERFDLIVLPIVGDGFVEIAMLARLIGARYRAGFDLDGGGLSFTHSIPFTGNESILTQYGRLLTAIGATGSADNIPLRPQHDAAAAVAARLEALGISATRIVVVHPWVGHHEGFRAWPPALFRELIERLLLEHGVAVVTVGSAAERALARQHFGDLASPGFCDLTGVLTMAETVALLERSRCLVCNDSCLIMIADGLGVPSVAIFGSTAPEQVLAKASVCRAVRTDKNLPCQPCYLHQTLFQYQCSHDFECLKTVAVDRVLGFVHAALAGATSPHELPATSS
jgi:heptosyltransferase-2